MGRRFIEGPLYFAFLRSILVGITATFLLHHLELELVKLAAENTIKKAPYSMNRIPYLIGTAVALFALSTAKFTIKRVLINTLLGLTSGVVIVLAFLGLDLYPKVAKNFHYLIVMEIIFVLLINVKNWLDRNRIPK